jgi:hypothetical protein
MGVWMDAFEEANEVIVQTTKLLETDRNRSQPTTPSPRVSWSTAC